MRTDWSALALMVAWFPMAASAVSVGEKEADNSPEAEQASFTVHEDFEVNLFADESLGIANPVAMHWDEKGRLWVLTTLTYAQLEPGERADDTLVILEDTDGDGRADESTVFADGLNMPMGFALGYGGVYLGEGPDLVFLEDTDGDGKADRREVLLTGFGTGDTHQNISNFTWGPDGCLYFCQGLHCYSRVETPWGIVRGEAAGLWRFHPTTLRLEPFLFPSLASQNPCGICFDRDGALFLKSNNQQLIYVTPGLIPTTHEKNLVPVASIGATPGKSMGAEYVESPHLPDWLQDHILVAGYYANRVTAFPLEREGAGFARVEPVELLRAEHTSFRPVEIKVGPDGAIYVADWFNPIIGHYQASLRHPDRDEEHGRVWRIRAQGREDVPKIVFSNFDNFGHNAFHSLSRGQDALLREHARQYALREIANGNLSLEEFMRAGALSDPLLSKEEWEAEFRATRSLMIAQAKLKGRRAPFKISHLAGNLRHIDWTARLIGVLGDNDDKAREVLKVAAESDSARDRLEAVVACANLADARALSIALRALDHPRDRFLDYALEQCVHALAPQWLPALQEGRLTFAKPEHLAYALRVRGGPEALAIARSRAFDAESSSEIRSQFAAVVAAEGGSEDYARLLAEMGEAPAVLAAMAEAWPGRKVKPEDPAAAEGLRRALASEDTELQRRALVLTGLWQVQGLADEVRAILSDESRSAELRAEAVRTFARLDAPDRVEVLSGLLPSSDGPLAAAALESFVMVAPVRAARAALPLLRSVESPEEAGPLLQAFFSRKGGVDRLAEALENSGNTNLGVEAAGHLAAAMGRLGRSDPALLGLLQDRMGVDAGARAHSPEFVAALVEEIEDGGDAEAGKEIFARAQLSCVACHQIGGAGGITGPSLDAVGAGLPLDLLVESVLWPGRQLKEGYFAIAVTTKGGDTYSGYREKEENGVLHLRDTATGEVRALPRVEIAKVEQIGSLMPEGLTATLSREELRDLVAYLASLRG